jgi:hypothetical protein
MLETSKSKRDIKRSVSPLTTAFKSGRPFLKAKESVRFIFVEIVFVFL